MRTPREPGQRRKRYRLAEARNERAWTQDRAADKMYKLGIKLGYPRDMLGVDARMVSNWERGEHDPKPHYVRILCKLYERSEELLDLAPYMADTDPGSPSALIRATDAAGAPNDAGTVTADAAATAADIPAFAASAVAQLEDHMRRRTFARFLALAGGAALFRPDILATVFDGGIGIDDALADRLHERSLQYMKQWDHIPPLVLLTVAMGHLEEIRTAIGCSRSPRVTRRLHVIASETAAFMGMLGWFIQDRSVAEIGLTGADEHSEAAGHPPVQAIVLTIRADFHSHVQLGRQLGSAITRTMLEAAESVAGAEPSPARAWILLRQAEEYAVIGQESDSNHYLDAADTTLAAVAAMPQGMLSHWSADMHRAFRGNCAQLLGKYRESIDILSPVLRQISPSEVSNRISLQTDMAAVLARQGEPDQASSLLADALASAGRAGLRERVKRVEGIRSGPLDRYRRHPAVRRLDDQLRSLPPASGPSAQ